MLLTFITPSFTPSLSRVYSPVLQSAFGEMMLPLSCRHRFFESACASDGGRLFPRTTDYTERERRFVGAHYGDHFVYIVFGA